MDITEWADYNASRAVREIRPLAARVIELAGPGQGRLAVELGAGSGVEAGAFLAAGWRVLAIDGDATTADRIRAYGDGYPAGALEVRTADFADITELPPADLVYSGYALPYAPPAAFPALWAAIRAALQPGGWFAAHLFGDRDSMVAEGVPATFLSRAELDDLLTGLDIVDLVEEAEMGDSYSGPKFWHVFHTIAQRPD